MKVAAGICQQTPSHYRVEREWGNGRALLYMPKVDQAQALICFLHGSGENAQDSPSLANLRRHGSPAAQAENGATTMSNFVVLCPQLPCQREWQSRDQKPIDSLVNDILGGLKKSVPTILTGFSFGGAGVFVLGASRSGEKWSALWAVAPTPLRGKPTPAFRRRILVHYSKSDSAARAEEVTDYFKIASGEGRIASNWRIEELVQANDHLEVCKLAYDQPSAYEWLLGTDKLPASSRS